MRGMAHIGILTGGGDVPGLNSVIKSVTYRSSELGWSVSGIRRGWQGLTHLAPGTHDPQYVRSLDRATTRAIDRTGGTVLHTSRTNPARMPEAGLPEHLTAAERASLRTDDGSYDL
ncbi:MAG TPA: 6-phosphofructokinase, partial [Candidatus Limnocylindria bacterium]|nr:6-phosphofructokinase [Candidatus Limnocylindria bacterium]